MSEPTHIKADLVPFSDEYIETVRSWIDDEETYLHVCRGKEFPPPENVVKSWQRSGVTSYLLFSGGKPVAYGELWNRPNDLAKEIGHLLVAPSHRYQGFGTKLLELLINRAATRSDVAKVIARLFHEDEIILSSLMKAGFEISGTNTYTDGLRLVKMIS